MLKSELLLIQGSDWLLNMMLSPEGERREYAKKRATELYCAAYLTMADEDAEIDRMMAL